MQFNATETSAAAFRLPLFNLRWSGVIAGLVVGVATYLALLLVGVTVGLATFNVGALPTGGKASMAVMLWNIVSLLVAAFIGGYVAARGAGMRRASDGVFHGVVAWGVALLVVAFVATSATGSVFGSLLYQAPGTAAATADAATRLQEGDRQAAIDVLRNRLGLSEDQAGRVVDQALVAAGQPERTSPGAREQAENGIKTLSAVGAWLSAAVIVSLLATISGGVLGARAARRMRGTAYLEKRRDNTTESRHRTVVSAE